MYRKLWRYRALTFALVRRQYQLRYRQSAGGFAWALLPPVASLFVSTVVFHKVLNVQSGQYPYALFTLAGLAPWIFFSSGISVGIPSITSSMTMVNRLAFPRGSLPLSMLGTSLIDFGLTSVLFVVYAYVSGIGLPVTALWFPLLVVPLILFTTGITLLGSAMNVFARDIRLALPLVTQLWLLITPVMYPLSSVPDSLRNLYLLNPMTGLVESFRAILLYGNAPSYDLLAPAVVGSVVVMIVGGWYFGATEARFADVI